MNTMLGLPQNPHLLNKESCVAEYVCTHTTRIYIYKLETVNAHSQALWDNASFQFSHLPQRDIAVDFLFLWSFSIHVLNPTPALNHAVLSLLEVKKVLRKSLSGFNCWSSHRWHFKELQYGHSPESEAGTSYRKMLMGSQNIWIQQGRHALQLSTPCRCM